MRRLISLLTTLLAPLLLALPVTADPDPTATNDTPTKIYSPFAIALEGGQAFTIVTFEDVGMHLDGEVVPALLYEVISQSVAERIGNDDGLSYDATAIYEPRLTQPHEHVFCDERHLYVALWRGFAPHRWGFSLWSGCGAEDQFAWLEVPAPYDDTLPFPELVEPLSMAIVDALREAEARQCFQLHC